MKNKGYQSVLIYLAKLSDGQSGQKPISLLFLSKQIGIKQDVLGNIIELLRQDGYVNVQRPNSKTILISPTIKGLEKASLLKNEGKAKSFSGRFWSTGKLIWGSLLVALLGSLWWWLGLSNEGKEPLINTAVPFKVYNQWTSSLISKRGGGPYYEAKNITLRDGEISNPDGTITATLDGRFVLRFQIESNALNHQINIQSIDVRIERDSAPDVTDVLQGLIGLGGGEIRDFEVPLNATENLALGESVMAHAQLMIADQAVDYIYLRPGEREVIQVIVNLDGVGRYKVTPIINYAFQAKNSSLALGSSVVVFPERYRYWNAEFNGPMLSNDMLPVGNIILNTKNLDFVQSNPTTYARQACFNLDKWIAFVSLLSKDDQRLFVFNTKTGVFEMLSDVGKTIHILGWDNAENLYFTEEKYNDETDELEKRTKNWNPMVGLKQIEPSYVPASLLKAQKYDTKCLEEQNICLDTPKQDTNGDGVVTDADLDQVALVDTNGNVVRRIGFSQTWQAEPLLSPDKTNLIYKEGQGCPPSNPEKLFITDVYGNNLRQLISFPSDHRSITWFPNGQELAFAANRSVDNNGNPSCDDESYGIYSINVQTGAESTITHGSRYDTIFGWSSDEQWLVIGGKYLSLVNQSGSCLQTITPAFIYFSDYIYFVPSFAEAVIQP